MSGGYIQGGVGFVVLAYGVTWAVLLAYIVHLWHTCHDVPSIDVSPNRSIFVGVLGGVMMGSTALPWLKIVSQVQGSLDEHATDASSEIVMLGVVTWHGQVACALGLAVLVLAVLKKRPDLSFWPSLIGVLFNSYFAFFFVPEIELSGHASIAGASASLSVKADPLSGCVMFGIASFVALFTSAFYASAAPQTIRRAGARP